MKRRKQETVSIIELGPMTTYDPITDTFGNASTILGGPLSPDEAIEILKDARKRHSLKPL